jgi:hypothetical protein
MNDGLSDLYISPLILPRKPRSLYSSAWLSYFSVLPGDCCYVR